VFGFGALWVLAAGALYQLRIAPMVGCATTAVRRRPRLRALVVPDPRRAAEHFAFLVLGATLDRAMFEGEQSIPSDAELQRTADDAARAFLVAYGAR
jgi:hypothetical protein